jgi:hypothetical protein
METSASFEARYAPLPYPTNHVAYQEQQKGRTDWKPPDCEVRITSNSPNRLQTLTGRPVCPQSDSPRFASGGPLFAFDPRKADRPKKVCSAAKLRLKFDPRPPAAI